MGDLKINGPSVPPTRADAPRPPARKTGPLPALPFEPVPVPVDNLRVVPGGSSMQSLDWLDAQALKPDPYATFTAHFRIQDIDGLDQNSKGDMRGQLDADVSLKRGLFDRSIQMANAQSPSFKFGVSFENGVYRIPITYPNRIKDVTVGSIYLKPEGGKLKVEIGGLAGGLASGLNFVSFGNVKPIIDNLIHSMSQDLGFKVTSSSVTDYTLEPDLQNSPLFREQTLAGGEKIKLESVSSGQGSLVNLSTDSAGNLNMSVKNLDVVASSAPGGAPAVADAEGPDQMRVDAKGQLNRDFSTDITTDFSLSLDVKDTEKAGLQARIKALTGQDLPASGKVSIENLRVQTHVNPTLVNGLPDVKVTSQGGQISADKLDLQFGPYAANLASVEGGLNVTHQGNITRVEAADASLKGKIGGPMGQLQLQEASLSGVLQYDQSRPNDFRFALSPDATFKASGSFVQGNQSIGIQSLNLRNAELQAKFGEGQLQLLGANGKDPEATIQKLTLPDTDLRNIQLTGTLNASLGTSAIDLDAKSFSLGGKVGDIRVDSLSGSGRMHFDPQNGIQLENASFNARGKAGTLGFPKLSGNGSLTVSPSGQVTLSAVTGLNMVTDLGLSLRGSFKGQLVGQSVNLETLGTTTAKFDFKAKPGTPESQVEVHGLGLKGAHMDADLSAGRLGLSSAKGQQLNATAQSLILPGIELKTLSMKGGQLSADVNGGKISLQSLPKQPLTATAAQINLPDVKLSDITVKGNLVADTHTGTVELDADSFDLKAKLIGVDLEKLKGSGKVHIEANGRIRFDEIHNLDLETSIGLDLKGDFKGEINNLQISADTLGSKPAQLAYKAPDGSMELKGLQMQGHLDTDFSKNQFSFGCGPSGSLKLASGSFGGLNVKDVAVSGGTLSYRPGEFAIAPAAAGAPFKASGEVSGVKIGSLESTGPVVYDFDQGEVRLEQPAKIALPAHGVQELRTNGPVSLQALPSGEIVFSSHGSTIDAAIGGLKLENLKTDGQVIYNPANGTLRFAGFDGKPLSVDGTFNGKPLKLASSGQIQIQDTGSAFKISGTQIKMAGLVDGFTLDSPEGSQGTVSVRHDFSGFQLEDLNFGFSIDNVSVNKGGGSVKTTPDGLEISLKGAIGAERDELAALLGKLSNQADFGANFQGAMGQVNTALKRSIADFQNAQLNFENLTIRIAPNGSLQSFNVDNNTHLKDAKLEADLFGKKKVLPMGDVAWTAKVEGDANNLRIPSGHIGFALTPELRAAMADEIKTQLEDAGLKKVKLQIEPDGHVKIQNATVNGRVIDLSARMELSTRIVNNQLEVSLDKMHLRNFLLDIVGQIAGAPDKVADQVDTMLQQQHLKYQRRNAKGAPDPQSGRVFALDLQALIKQINPGVTLKNASLDAKGNVQMDYAFETKM